MAQKQQKQLKKKKKWFQIVAPKEFREEILGETSAFEEPTLIGRKIGINLMNLLGDPKKQNSKLVFRISEIKDGKAYTELVSYEMLQAFIRRLNRKDANKIEDSFICDTKDNVKLVFKPILVTNNKAKNEVLTLLRQRAREFIAENTKKLNYNDVVDEVISTNAQKSLRSFLKKVYPLSVCEFKEVTRL